MSAAPVNLVSSRTPAARGSATRGRSLAAGWEVLELEAAQLRGAIRADLRHPVFAGHFPRAPVLPGVCLIDCADALSRRLLADTHPAPRLEELERASFLAPVHPGRELSAYVSATAAPTGRRCAVALEAPSGPVARIRLRYADGCTRPSTWADEPPRETTRMSREPGLQPRLPHRNPMLLLDEAGEISDGEVRARATTSAFKPVLRMLEHDADGNDEIPAFLLLESWCQAAALLAGSARGPHGLTLLGKLSQARFAAGVSAGQTLEHRVRLVREAGENWLCTGESRLDGRLALSVGSAAMTVRPTAEIAGRQTPAGHSQRSPRTADAGDPHSRRHP